MELRYFYVSVCEGIKARREGGIEWNDRENRRDRKEKMKSRKWLASTKGKWTGKNEERKWAIKGRNKLGLGEVWTRKEKEKILETPTERSRSDGKDEGKFE